MRILVIDSNIDRDCWGSQDLTPFLRKTTGTLIETRRAPQKDFPKHFDYDRVILSGSLTPALDFSAWTESFCSFIVQLVDKGIPILGICYGHQMIARALFGKEFVRKAEKPEFGWTRLKKTASSSILKGLPKEFISFSSHYDEVYQLSDQVVHLCESERCKYQAFQLPNKPVYSIQFHPEKGVSEGKKTFSELKGRGEERHFLGQEKDFDPKIGKQIFSNFLTAL